jgi:hypothetical protein
MVSVSLPKEQKQECNKIYNRVEKIKSHIVEV